MPTIKIPQLNKSFQVKVGVNLMQSLQENEVPVASSCLGDGVCGKCVLKIAFQNNSIFPLSAEEKVLKEKYSFNDFQRASCQIEVNQDIIVESSYW